MKRLITITLILLFNFFPSSILAANQTTTSALIPKIQELNTDFSPDKIGVKIEITPQQALNIVLKSDSTETNPSDLDDQLGIEVQQVTVTDPDNSSNSFTIPVEQVIPLSSLRTGFGFTLPSPATEPVWMSRKSQIGGSVNIEVKRDLVEISTNQPPTRDDWFKLTNNNDSQVTQQEDAVDVKLSSPIVTQQPISKQALGGVSAPPVPTALPPTAAPTAAPCAGSGCVKGGSIPCSAGNGIMTAIGCIRTNPTDFVTDLIRFVIGISGGFSFLLMLMGVFQMMRSAGNPDALQAGRDRLTSAVIGLLFIIFTVLLLQIIGMDILHIPGFEKAPPVLLPGAST